MPPGTGKIIQTGTPDVETQRPRDEFTVKMNVGGRFRFANPELFRIFAVVSFHNLIGFHPDNSKKRIPMKKKLLFTAAWLLAAGSLLAQPKVIAHRGYWTAPESAQNSLASFTKADAIGAFGSEFDVWMTADDKLIVNHDKVYKGTDINMEKATAKEVTQIVLPNGENIPTLDQYLQLAAQKPATRVILEMKTLSDYNREDLAAEKIVKALKKYGLVERTDIISFSLNACLAFKKLLPDTKIYYLNGDLTPKSIQRLGLAGIDYSEKVLRKHPEWVKQAHELGLEVNVWTVDKEESMKYFIDLGVDYITTNYPEKLQAMLK